MSTPKLRARAWLPPVAAALLATACGDGGTAVPVPVTRPEPEGGPFSVQLHVHGSFSEGIGSIDSHSWEAQDLGVDVIWWSDHDFRITSYRHVTSFGFEDLREPVDAGEDWSVREDRERFADQRGWKFLLPDERYRAPGGSFELVAGDAYAGERSLRLATSAAGDDFERFALAFGAPRDVHRRPLASGVTLRIAVLPEELGPDARAVIEIDLSEHAPRAGHGLEPYALRYELGAAGKPRWEGTTYVVPREVRTGSWSVLDLPVTADALRALGAWLGEDNSLHAISFGVEARRGARASARFDAFEILQEREGEAAYARQADLIGAAQREYRDTEQLQGVEITYASQHLNEFTLETELLDYDALEALADAADPPIDDPESYRAFVARQAIDAIHARGGIVSFNHMYGASVHAAGRRVKSREEVLAELLDTRLFGADLLEVGYRMRGGHPLEDHLWVWDRLALAGLRVVGTGVSDSHGGPEERWRDSLNNFVSWIYAPSTGKADLIGGLRRGRVFFGDRARFDGQLELWTDEGHVMGETVATRRDAIPVTVEIVGLERGDVVTFVEAGEPAASLKAEARLVVATHTVRMRPEGSTLVRVEVRAADGEAKVFSNPIWFVRPE